MCSSSLSQSPSTSMGRRDMFSLVQPANVMVRHGLFVNSWIKVIPNWPVICSIMQRFAGVRRMFKQLIAHRMSETVMWSSTWGLSQTRVSRGNRPIVVPLACDCYVLWHSAIFWDVLKLVAGVLGLLCDSTSFLLSVFYCSHDLIVCCSIKSGPCCL